ncbi:hypothetical protein K6N86_001631 [Providencia rettgeri]|nr:hypothetical protein [Providencia rettgeri]
MKSPSRMRTELFEYKKDVWLAQKSECQYVVNGLQPNHRNYLQQFHKMFLRNGINKNVVSIKTMGMTPVFCSDAKKTGNATVLQD